MDVDLAKAFNRNTRLVMMQCDGIDTAASLTQSDANINCLNWVVGHIVDSRNTLLELLGSPPADQADLGAYERESEPITGPGPDVVEIETLLAMLDTTQERLATAISPMDADAWSAPLADNPERTLADNAFFWYFHDTYHVGQTELLRQVSGANDSLI